MSGHFLTHDRRRMQGFLLAVALYATWTFATWLLEGRAGLLVRPAAAGERALYAVVANLMVGIVAAMAVLRHLIRQGTLARCDAGFGPATPSPMRLVTALGLGSAFYVLQGAAPTNPIVTINAVAQVLTVSSAEVMVCWALVGAAVETWLRPFGRVLSLIGAALAASVLFGVYHLAHSAPFNTPGMIVLLTAVGLVTSLFFLLARDVYATILFHNFLGVFGVVQSLEASGRLHSLETLQPALLIMALVTVGVLAISDRAMLRSIGQDIRTGP